MDGYVEGVDCKSMDSMICDRCWAQAWSEAIEGIEDQGSSSSSSTFANVGRNAQANANASKAAEESGSQAIARKLREQEELDAEVVRVMDVLKRGYIFCQMMLEEPVEAYDYIDCLYTKAKQCSRVSYMQWQERIDLGAFQNCWECGLAQSMCQ